jgi:hypothetical protein
MLFLIGARTRISNLKRTDIAATACCGPPCYDVLLVHLGEERIGIVGPHQARSMRSLGAGSKPSTAYWSLNVNEIGKIDVPEGEAA